MKNCIASILVLTGLHLTVVAQKNDVEVTYAQTIKEADMKELLTIIASDAMEGRETGTRGQKMAAAFIREQFRTIGLQPPVDDNGRKSYFQHFNLYSSVPGETYLTVNGEKKMNFEEIIHIGSGATREVKDIPVIFAGDGSEETLGNMDTEGKSLVVWTKDRRQMQELLGRVRDKKIETLLVIPTGSDDEFYDMINRYKNYLSGGRLSPEKPETSDATEVFMLSPSLAASILRSDTTKMKKAMENGKLNKIKEGTIGYKISSTIKTVETENVLGYLEGTDKKDELVVVTAHFDHIGRNGDEINNGADDDGSGTTSVLEIAEAFAKARDDGHGPRRSMLFMTVTGEEKGLLGSDYYTKNPVFPLSSTVVDLNIDMVGRVDPQHKDSTHYVYLVGSDKLSTTLHKISEKANETYIHYDLDYTYNDENHPDRIYYRSDHWNFAKNNIPVIFYFDGIHEDYHRPTDTVEKINFDLMQERARLVFYTAWELANRDERIKVDVGNGSR